MVEIKKDNEDKSHKKKKWFYFVIIFLKLNHKYGWRVRSLSKGRTWWSRIQPLRTYRVQKKTRRDQYTVEEDYSRWLSWLQVNHGWHSLCLYQVIITK